MNKLQSLKARHAELKNKTSVKDVGIKTKIIDLLNTKNDKGEKMFNFSPSIIPTTPWKYSSDEDMRYYMWLCQVQKWLRDEYERYVHITPTVQRNSVEWTNNIDIRENISFNSFEEALESGIYQILTILIKNNGRNN